MDFENFFLQPMDGPDVVENTELTVRYCLDHPQWRLSLQTHKIVGIRWSRPWSADPGRRERTAQRNRPACYHEENSPHNRPDQVRRVRDVGSVT